LRKKQKKLSKSWGEIGGRNIRVTRKASLLILFLILITISAFSLQITQITIHETKLLYPTSLIATSLTDFDIATVVRVVDGDTAHLKGVLLGKYQDTSTRFIGIDTPETVDPRKPVQYFGKQASAFTKKILTGQRVYITYDQNLRDKYHRLLAYIWLKFDNKYYMFNAILVLNGYAHNYPYFPFKKEYMRTFHNCEIYAREHNLGLWGKSETLESSKEETTGDLKIVYIDATSKDEYVEIKNESNKPINLQRWKLKSDPNQWYTFPAIILQPGQSIKIHSGKDASGQYIWTKRYIWRNNGDICWLYDPFGKEIDVYKY
jgi:micrococcal nuclease